MSRSTALAEAVKDILNAIDFSMEFTAMRSYRASYTYKELKTLRVTVIAPIVEQRPFSRVGNIDDVSVHIIIQKQAKPADIDTVDALADFTEEIAEHFRGTRCRQWIWLETKIVVPYDPEDLTEGMVFTSVIEMRYQIAWKKV